MPTPPSFGHLRSVLTTTFGNGPDNRTSRNRLHTLSDAALGASSVFFTQTPSFLAYQRHVLLMLILLAFLCHTVLQLADSK